MEKVLSLPILVFSCLALGLLKPVLCIPTAAEVIDPKGEGRIFYDQRQTGKFNIHLSIKDVAIIEMNQNEFEDDSVSDEDYYYDESDFTVKPYPSWATKPPSVPSTTSIKPLINNVSDKSSTIKPTSSLPNQSPQPILIPISTLSTTKAPNVSLAYLISNLINRNTTLTTSNSANPNGANTIKISSNEQVNNATIAIDITTPIVLDYHKTSLIIPDKPMAHLNGNLAQSRETPVLHPHQIHPLLSTLLKRPTATEFNSALHKETRKPDDNKLNNFRGNPVSTSLGYTFPFSFYNNQRRCRSGHARNEAGSCRKKRPSSSLLRKLFKVLVSLPLYSQDATSDSIA